MAVYNNVLDMIGNTPLLKLHKFDTGPCELFLKLEYQNPGGSIKDRIAKNMIELAEKQGKLKPGYTIVEGTAGNTGLGLALVAACKGYRLLIVMPDKMGKEKITHLRAMGAEVIITRSDVEKGHPEYYLDLAQRLASEIDNAFYVNQFANPDNPLTHELTTGPEIWQQMDGKIDAFVHGMGSSGAMTGIGRYLRRMNPQVELILADPKGSILADLINTGVAPTPGKWLVEGIGEDFVPVITDISVLNEGIYVNDQQATIVARELLIKEGVFAGSSTGTHLYAALQYCRKQTEAKRVVTIACDTGNKYLAKLYNDEWMWNQGFSKRQEFGDLRDLIARPLAQHLTVAIGPNEPIATAHKHMITHDISQVPVLQNKQLIGIVCAIDLLHSVATDGDFMKPAQQVMMINYPTVTHDTTFSVLLSLFNKHNAIAIMHDNQFCGLISIIDAINYYKRKQLL